MIRRSRISVRPNVSTRPSVSTGKPAAPTPPQDAPSVNKETSEAHVEVKESNTAVSVTDTSAVVPPEQKATAGDGKEQTAEATSSPAALQRRKRFSVKPKVAPGRIANSARTPKSPVKAVSESPAETACPDHGKPTTSSQIGTAAPRLRSPSRRRLSEDGAQPKEQPTPTCPSSAASDPSAVPAAGDSPDQPQIKGNEAKKSEVLPGSQAKEDRPRPPDKVPPSLPEKEALEISEKAKTLVSSESRLSTLPPKCSLSRLLNDPSDLQRLAKARKLRELLRQEIHKEKKLKKNKVRVKEYTLDPAKMTMRDLIHYLPLSNPMTSLLEDCGQEIETVVTPSPAREDSPERAQEPNVLSDAPKTSSSLPSQREEEEEEEEEATAAEAEGEGEEDEPLMVPQVKVAEDGSLIIDEESLTVEVQRAKGPNPFQDRDPIFERGSTTTYSSFRKGTYTKPWSNEETDMFFLAISMVGTDFSMVCQLFPHRARSEIKNKFKKEERQNAWRIDKAFREKRKLDIEYFSKLLEKILEYQKNKKKLKSLTEKNTPKKRSRQTKGKKAARKLSDVEEDEEEEHDAPDVEEEDGEKENEGLSNEGGSPVSTPKRKRKRKDKNEASTEEPNNMEINTRENNNEKGDACIPEDAEAALPQDHTELDMLEKTESANAAKGTAIQPAGLSRARAPKPQLPLARKRATKHPAPAAKPKDTASDVREERTADQAAKKQDASPSRPTKEEKLSGDDISSEGKDSSVIPPRPTRYGRLPKPTQHLNYLAKEDTHCSASESTPGSASPAASSTSAAKPKPKCTAKRGRSSRPTLSQKSKKPKLVTLRASQSEYSDDEDESQREEEELEEAQNPPSSSSKDSSAPVFVPVGLRSPEPVFAQVEETMEELDILASVPDVLGMSQDPPCPDASCEKVPDETGTAGPCEHQLDLLVGVIDFMSADNVEVSEDEVYNEAAQTLLTIGHLTQSAQNQICNQDDASGSTAVTVNETCGQQQEEVPSEPAAQEVNSMAPAVSAASAHAVTEAPQSVDIVETEHCITDRQPLSQTGHMSVAKKRDETCNMQKTISKMDPVPQLESSSEISKPIPQQARRGCLLKVKPKPNLGHASRITQSTSQRDTSPVRTFEESHSSALDLCQDTRSQSALGETSSKMADSGPASLTDELPCTRIKVAEEPSESEENTFEGQPGFQVESSSATSGQSRSFSEPQFVPSLEQATKNSESTPQSTDEELKSHVRTAHHVNPGTSDSAVTESQVLSNTIDPNPVQVDSEHPPACVTPVEQLSTSQKEDSEAASTCQTRKTRFHKIKPKPNLRQTSRAVHSKCQLTEDAVTHLEAVEKTSSPTANTESSVSTVAHVELQPHCGTTPHEKTLQSNNPASVLTQSLDLGSAETTTEESSAGEVTKTNVVLEDRLGSNNSEHNVPEKRRHKIKPNLGLSTRTTRPKLELMKDNRTEQHHMNSFSNVTTEQQALDRNSANTELETTENVNEVLMSSSSTKESESERTVKTTNAAAVSPESINTGDTMAPASEGKQEMSASTEESNTKPTELPSAVSENQSLDVGSTQSKTKSLSCTNEYTEPDPHQNAQQSSSEVKSQDAVQQCLSGSSATNRTAEDSSQAAKSKSEPTDQQSSNKAPHTRRARLPKPKPNLGRSVRPPQHQTVQNMTQADSGSGPCSEAAGGLGSHHIALEISPDIQKPVDGVVEQLGNQSTPQSDAGCPLGCETQTPGHSTQDTSTPSTGGTQSCPSLTIFQDILQAPTDPDEPFFILSLTEIPVSSSEEVIGSGSEPLLCPTVTDNTPIQQQRLEPTLISQSASTDRLATPEESLAVANVVMSGPTEEIGKTGNSSAQDAGPDQAASTSSITGKPVDPCERTTVQPELPKTEESEKTDVPLKNQRLTGRRAKLQVKPITTKKQASETVAAEEAELIPTQSNSDLESKLPCPSVQPEPFIVTATAGDEVFPEAQKESTDHPDIGKDTLMKGEHAEDSSSGVQTQTSLSLTQSRVTRNLNRKPKGFLSFLSEKTCSASSGSSPPTKAAPRGPKVRAPQRKRCTPVPVASTSQGAIPTPSTTPAVQSTSSTTVTTHTEVDAKRAAECTPHSLDPKATASLCTDVISAPQQSDGMEGSSVEDEPTNVSQYFLSDIFTEVDEG